MTSKVDTSGENTNKLATGTSYWKASEEVLSVK